MTTKRLLSKLLILTALVVPGVLVAETVAVPAVQAQADNGQQNNQNNKATKNAEDRSGENVDPITGTVVKDTSVVGYISSAYNWLAIIGGLLAVIMLIYAGYSYMSSSGDPEKISNAKDIVEKALLGLGLLIIATVLLRAVNTRTVDPCKPGQDPGCGAIDFTKPDGGVKD